VVGPSALELQRGSGHRPGGPAIQATRTVWRAAGRAGAVAVVIGVVATVSLAAWWVPITARVLGTAAALLVLIAAALVDAVEHRLPNRLVAAAVVPVLLTLGVAWSGVGAIDVAVGASYVAVPLLLTHLVTPAGMGFGDVKAGAVLGAGVGLVDAQLALFGLVAGLAIGASWGLARRARSVPLGPALVAGALAALAVGRLLVPEGRL
jgi:leader peptidase (prepilin peptidase)/N-methyltransferase